MLAAAELIRGGVTTVNDMYYDGRIIAETLKETGLSGIVSTCLIGIADDHEARFEEAKELAESYRMDPSIRTAIAPHAEYTTTVPLLERWVCEAVDTGQPVHIHCSETESEHEECKKRHGVTPVGLFHRIGLFEVPALLAHCVWTDESDIELIATNGASVLHNPCSNMKLGSGFSPIPAMLDRGIRIALSSDGAASNNSLDMWEEMRIAALIHKGRTGDATAVSSAEALYMATRGAAIALGFADRGSVAAGQRADFIVIDPRQPSYFPKTNLMNLIVYSGNSRDIELTVAGGDVLYDRGTYTKLDIEKVYSESEEAFRNVFGK
jgi:5-methylthioadenosine/S-adenosylhomocysteine deaminase